MSDPIVSPPHGEEGSGVVVANHRVVTIVAILILTALISTFFLLKSSHPTVRLPDGTVIAVEIADSPKERRIGLSDHIFLDPDRGMLFLLDGLSRPAFWMKDMRFPIDIVWLRERVVVGIQPSLQPTTVENPPSVRPASDITEVLEVNAGFAAKHHLKIGDELSYE